MYDTADRKSDSDYDFMIADSGCSTTILGNKSMFEYLTPSKARVQTADGKIIRVEYEGPVNIVVVDKYNTERVIRLPRAFYCPNMHTLLSVKQLVLLDHDVIFSKRSG